MNHDPRPLLRLLGRFALALAVGCGGGSPPPAPTLDAVDSPTRDNPLMLAGSGEEGATIQVRDGVGSAAEGTVGPDGRFEISVPLSPDRENALVVWQVAVGGVSEPVAVSVVHDGTAPDAPVLDPATNPTRASTVTLRGSAEAGAELAVTGGLEELAATVDGFGRFEVEVPLRTATGSATENDLAVVATDPAGNASPPARVTILHDPSLSLAAPVLGSVPAFTNAAALSLTGSAHAGATLAIEGGAEAVTATAGADGSFIASVSLRPNSPNDLAVVAVVEATGVSSEPARVTVVHDDVAPAIPEVDPVASPTSARVLRVTGRSEGLARIAIEGGAAPANGVAGEDGDFALDVLLVEDAERELSIVATDRAGNLGDPAVVMIAQDSSLEAPVLVDGIPSPTRDNPVTVSGRTEPSAEIRITGGSAPATTSADADGLFRTSVTLAANTRNELHVSRVGSAVETLVVVVHDDVAPDAPVLDALESPTMQTDLTVSGSAEPDARVSVSGGVSPAGAAADGTGRFAVAVTIEEDRETNLLVIATDRAGNSSPPSLASVTHQSTTSEPPELDAPNPPPTNQPTHLVTGTVTTPGPGITIHIVGGAAAAMGDADESTGRFSVEVTLNANDVNVLEVRSRDGGSESPASIVTITHDDVAPDAPEAGRISLGPGGTFCIVRAQVDVTGEADAVEALSRVRVANFTNGGASVSVDAASDGSFSAAIGACAGDVLRISATDEAGNTSPTTEMTVGS